MLHDLDAALARLLDDSAAPAALRAADVSFVTPTATYTPSADTLNVFLHELREDRELRDPVPIVEVRDGVYVQRTPPIRLECDYAVTAWSTATGVDLQVQQEHRLLGYALTWLGRFATLPGEFLEGDLANQPFAPPTLVAQPDADRFTGPFWSALGIPPRPAFRLSVVIAVDLARTSSSGPPVRTIRSTIGVDQEHLLHIGGHVRTRAGQPVPQAVLRVTETSAEATSDSEGRYILSGFAAGAYSIEVFAVGLQPTTQTVLVPGRPETYDIVLDPL